MVFGMGIIEILIMVALGVLVLLALIPGNGTSAVVDETIVPGVTAETADQVLFRELSELPGLPLVASHDGSYTLSMTSRPTWTIFAAVFLFPVGLLFLLLKDEHHVQVSVVTHGSGCRVRVVGRARKQDIDQLATAIERVLPVSVVGR